MGSVYAEHYVVRALAVLIGKVVKLLEVSGRTDAEHLYLRVRCRIAKVGRRAIATDVDSCSRSLGGEGAEFGEFACGGINLERIDLPDVGDQQEVPVRSNLHARWRRRNGDHL